MKNAHNVTALTLTGDRPEALALCAKYVRRQTLPVYWLVIDDGRDPQPPDSCDEYQLLEPIEGNSIARNLNHAREIVRTPWVAFMEDDDWYAPDHVEQLVGGLGSGTLMVGTQTRLYHVSGRYNTPAKQPNMRGLGATLLHAFAFRRVRAATFRYDQQLWRQSPGLARHAVKLDGSTRVAMKGMPGRRGTVSSHDHRHGSWRPDADGHVLRRWIGADADAYRQYANSITPATA